MIKKTLKFTLCALLLSAAGSAYAEGPVTLGNGSTVTWAEFAGVINGAKPEVAAPDSTAKAVAWEAYTDSLQAQQVAKNALKAPQDTLQALEDLLIVANDSLNARKEYRDGIMPQTETKTLKYSDEQWFKDQKSAFNDFKKEYDGGSVDMAYVWYYLPTSGRSITLYLSFTDPGDAIPVAGGTYTKISEDGLYNNVINKEGVSFSSVKVYLGKNATTGEYNYTPGANGLYTISGSFTNKTSLLISIEAGFETLAEKTIGTKTIATEAYTWANDRYQAQLAAVSALNKRITDQKGVIKTLQAALEAADAAVESTKATFIEEYNKYNTAVENAQADALAAYQEVTLTGDIEAANPITKEYSGVIYGGDNVINIASGNLFKRFSGELHNAAINGKFAEVITANATFNNVAVNTGSEYRYYNDGGTKTTYGDLDELGFAARGTFGIDFTTGKLVKLSATTKVYNITVYQPTTSTQYYVVQNGTKLTSKDGAVTIEENMFAKSATNDLKGISNIYYADGSKYVCDNVVIADKVNFYCPEEITAKNLNVQRTINAGLSTVCLPFDLKYTYDENLEYLCTYDMETPEKFWFTKIADTDVIPANTPALIQAKGEVDFSSLTNIKIAKTPETQLVDANNSYGTFKKVRPDQIAGGSNAWKVYALNGETFNPVSNTVSIPAFRMVLLSENAQSQNLAPRRIGIRDEKGIELGISGIDTVTEDVTDAFTISGGHGEINITSEADFGQVEVYSINGSVVAVANVVAGTTTVNVGKGLYIVMGKKVIVK